MQLKGTLAEAMNKQVTLELHSALAYEQLAIDMEMLDLPGIASWFRAQASEEREHAAKFINHMLDRDVRPSILDIPGTAKHADDVLSAFEASLEQEQRVSEAIRELYRVAQNEGDIDALPLLHWFIDEQIEEESTVSEIIGRVKLVGNDGNGLLRLDAELGSRDESDD